MSFRHNVYRVHALFLPNFEYLYVNLCICQPKEKTWLWSAKIFQDRGSTNHTDSNHSAQSHYYSTKLGLHENSLSRSPLSFSLRPSGSVHCSAHYPIPAATVMITTQLEALPKRHWKQRNHHHETTTTPTRGRGHSSKRAERWKDCQAKEHSFLSTLCHCIETTSTDTVTVVYLRQHRLYFLQQRQPFFLHQRRASCRRPQTLKIVRYPLRKCMPTPAAIVIIWKLWRSLMPTT